MDNNKRERFHILYERFIDIMTDPENFVKDAFIGKLKELCELLTIEKGVINFYINEEYERKNIGETFRDIDTKEGDTLLISRKHISNTGAVVTAALYVSSKKPKLDEEEIDKADLVLRSLISFISRNRLSTAIEDLGFHDEVGYKNTRAFTRFATNLALNNRLPEYTACRYNLKHFAYVNHKLGRANADIVMRNHTNIMSSTIGEDGIVSRLGGDNFVAIFKRDHLDKVLDILKGHDVYFQDGFEPMHLSSSAGIFDITENIIDNPSSYILDKLQFAIQLAMNGRYNSILFYDEKLRSIREKMITIDSLFDKAIANKEFCVYYQPKVDVSTGEIIGAEALCRWIKDNNVIPPDEFIPVFERSSNICKLDFYMLDAVCQDIRRWIDNNQKTVRISVNLSRRSIMNSSLSDDIIKIIDNYDIPRNMIEMELTETVNEYELKDLIHTVGGLNKAGIHVSVDDFGKGYSSLSLIKQLKWDVIKIDKCFLPDEDEPTNSFNHQIYKTMVSLTAALGCECITEGIETQKQLSILKANSCNIAQGYYFDKPLPKDVFEEKLNGGGYPKEML